MPSTRSSARSDARPRPARWRFLAVGTAGALILAAVAGWALAADDPSDDAVTRSRATGGVADAGDVAPDFELETLDGDTITLSQFRGRPVVVNFWASWCNPCRQEFPLLARALDDHRNDDLAVLGITFRDIESDSRDFVAEMDAAWPQGVDGNGEVAKAFGVRTIPMTFFVGPDGVIGARLFGFSSEDALEEPLGRILPS